MVSSSFNNKINILKKYNPGPNMYLRPHEEEIWIHAPKKINDGKLHHKPRLSLSFKKNMAHDWVTNWSGSLEKILDILKVSEFDKKLLLGDNYFINKDKDENKKIYLPNCYDLLDKYDIANNKIILKKEVNYYLNYLNKRKVLLRDILVYKIKFNNKFKSLNFLSYDKNNNYRGFVSKNIDRNYYFCKFDYEALFFENIIDFDKPIILVEGVFDAINLKNNSIPILGKNINYVTKRLNKLKFNNRIYLMLDSDVSFKQIRNIYDKLSKYFSVGAINLKKYNVKDPAELDKNSIKNIINNLQDFKNLKDYLSY